MPIGTFINMVAVIVGGTIGLLLHKNLPERIKIIVFQGLGLCVLVIGMQMALEVKNPLVLIFSILIGGIVGELIHLDYMIDNASELLKRKLKFKNERFTEGLVTAFIIFCVGSLTIVGSLNEGILKDRSLLLTKSLLDMFTAIALASTFGIGVLFSVIPMLIFQGGLTLFAAQFHNFFGPVLLAQLTATGGVLILGIGLSSMLNIKTIKIINLLPSLLIAILLTTLFLK